MLCCGSDEFDRAARPEDPLHEETKVEDGVERTYQKPTLWEHKRRVHEEFYREDDTLRTDGRGATHAVLVAPGDDPDYYGFQAHEREMGPFLGHEAKRVGPPLRTLRLYGPFPGLGTQQFRTLARNIHGRKMQLEELELSRVGLDSEGLRNVARRTAKEKNLKRLSLDRNGFGDAGLANAARNLVKTPQLESLDLALNDIGAEGMGHLASALESRSLDQLLQLDLSKNRIDARAASELAKAVKHAPRLVILNVSDNTLGPEGVRAFIPRLADACGALEELRLRGNGLGDEGATVVCDALGKFPTLNVLDLADNGVGDAPMVVLASRMLHMADPLEVLDLSNNLLTDTGACSLAHALRHLDKMRRVYLHGNQIDDKGVVELVRLRHPNLKMLNLVQDEPVSFRASDEVGALLSLEPTLTDFEGVDLGMQSTVRISNDVGLHERHDNRAVLAHLREALPEGERGAKASTFKAMLIGPGLVGKTSLVDRLVEDRFTGDARITDGLEVRRWHAPSDDTLQLVFYDLAGQPQYLASHAPFMRADAVFVACWDPRLETTTSFKLSKVHDFVREVLAVNPTARVVFVTTKADQGLADWEDTDVEHLRRTYGRNFCGHVATSAKTGLGVPELRYRLVAAANGLLHMAARVPQNYLKLQDKIFEWRDADDETRKFSLTPAQWRDTAEAHRVENADACLELFHQWGAVSHLKLYGDADDQIILDPQYLANVLACVITADKEKKSALRGGVLHGEDVDRVFAGYPKRLHKSFLKLLVDAHLAYPFRLKEGGGTDVTVVPAMCHSTSEPADDELEILLQHGHPNKAATLTLVFDFLPRRLASRLQCVLGPLVVENGWWQNGSIIHAKGDSMEELGLGRVEYDFDLHTIELESYGEFNLVHTSALNTMAKLINDAFPTVEVTKATITCEGDKDGHKNRCRSWTFSDIEDAYENRTDTLTCRCGTQHPVYSLHELLCKFSWKQVTPRAQVLQEQVPIHDTPDKREPVQRSKKSKSSMFSAMFTSSPRGSSSAAHGGGAGAGEHKMGGASPNGDGASDASGMDRSNLGDFMNDAELKELMDQLERNDPSVDALDGALLKTMPTLLSINNEHTPRITWLDALWLLFEDEHKEVFAYPLHPVASRRRRWALDISLPHPMPPVTKAEACGAHSHLINLFRQARQPLNLHGRAGEAYCGVLWYSTGPHIEALRATMETKFEILSAEQGVLAVRKTDVEAFKSRENPPWKLRDVSDHPQDSPIRAQQPPAHQDTMESLEAHESPANSDEDEDEEDEGFDNGEAEEEGPGEGQTSHEVEEAKLDEGA